MIKIKGLTKYEKHLQYELEKEQGFFSAFRDMLSDLGFGDESSNIFIAAFGRPSDEHGEPIETKEDDINNYSDKHYYFDGKEFRVDVVFGDKKIFIMINSNGDKQEQVSEIVQKYFSF